MNEPSREVGATGKDTIKSAVKRYVYEGCRDCVVVVMDRASPTGLREIPLSMVKVLGNYLVIGETVIPMHRVVEIRKGGKTVWRRKGSVSRNSFEA